MSYQPPSPKKSSAGLWLGGAVILLVALIMAIVLLLNRQPAPSAPAAAVIVSAGTATPELAAATSTDATPAPESTETPASTPLPELGTSNLFIEYILDASGSMSEKLSDGPPKIEVAQRVLTEHMRSFRPETNIGLRAYGHRLPYQQTAESCQDIELIAPPEKGQMERIAGWLQDFTVQGMTPLAASLELAKDDFIYDASRINSIVMLSDGIETCGGDPCQLVEDLKAEGVNFTIHVIGLDVDDPARQQLTCIAQAGGGTYHDARSQQELNAALGAVQADVTQDEVIVPPGVNTPTPQLADPAPLPIATAPVLAPLDNTNRASVLEWLFYALREGDLAVFDTLVKDEGISYVNFIEGGQAVAKADYLSDLAQRLPSEPHCDGYSEVAADSLQVWTSGWSPAWQMTQMCYGECQPIDPPWKSDIAAFFLEEVDGQWTIDMMWLNEMDIWENTYGVNLHACSEGSAAFPTSEPVLPTTEAVVQATELSPGQILFFSNRTFDEIDYKPGQSLDFTRHQLYVMESDGSNQSLLSAISFTSVMDQALSADRTALLVVDQAQNRLKRLNLSDPDTIASSRPGGAVSAAWSPDGSQIAFTEWNSAESAEQVWIMNADGTGSRQLTSGNKRTLFVDWSPDGSKLAIPYGYQLHFMDSGGSTPQLIYSGFTRDLAWSPDGSMIAFEGENAPNGYPYSDMDIWIIGADGSNPRNMTNSPSVYDTAPSWSPDGRFIVYGSMRPSEAGARSQIMKIDVATGEVTQLTTQGNNMVPLWVK